MIHYFIKSFTILLFLFLVPALSVAQSVGGTVTTAGPNSYCSATNSGVLTLAGNNGVILYWQSSTNAGITWNNIVNSTNNLAYFNLAQTTCYRAVVEKSPFPVDTSKQLCITIYQPSVAGVLSGGGSFCGSTGPGSLTLTGNTGSPLYWQSSTNAGATWNMIPHTGTTYNYQSITQSTLFRVIVQNTAACNKDTAVSVSFVIDPVTVAGTITGAVPVCITANSGILTLTGSTGNVSGWESSTNSGNTWFPIANTTKTLSFNNLTQTTWYRAIVKSGICAPDTSAAAIVTVSNPSIAGTLSGGGTYCGIPATGTLALTGYTGNITSWIASADNGLNWTTIANTTATEAYTNLPASSWYRAIVKNGACAADSSTIEKVHVAPQTIAGTIQSDKTVCYGLNEDTLKLTGNVGNVLVWYASTDSGLHWIPILNTATWQYNKNLTQTTWFSAVVQSGNCNMDTTAAVRVTVLPMNVVSAGMDVSINLGESVQLSGTGTGTPLWIPAAGLNNANILNPVASPSATTTYTLVVTDANNCSSADEMTITVTKSVFNGKVTNLFTPNSDGINDTWYIENIENFPDNEVTVYNTDGRVVYTQKGYTNNWRGTYNGTELPDGTYYYVIRFGNTGKTIKGSLDILGK